MEKGKEGELDRRRETDRETERLSDERLKY
jgi:hypothetical protein